MDIERDRITIMLVAPGSKGARSLNFKVSHLKLAFFIFVMFSAASIFSFASTYTFYKNSESTTDSVNMLVSTINILNEDITENKLIESKLRDRLQNIESKLLEMRDLLDKKGINKQLAVGGEFIPADRLSLSYVNYMEKDIEKLIDTMKNVPLGIPHKGKINSSFGYRKDPFRKKLAFHSGIDIDANRGVAVVATADGVVSKAERQNSYGKTVVIKHKDNYETLYGHLSKISVKEGQVITAGDTIGKAGSTGRSTGIHLHYEVLKDGKRVNPKQFLSLK